MAEEQSQSDAFNETDLDYDEDEGRWNEKLKKVAGHKPAPEKPE